MSWQPGITLDELERSTILSALRFFNGNRTHTANALGISVRTVLKKIVIYKEQGFVVPEALYHAEEDKEPKAS